jgi:beta-phosphoglucomutase family hydrolase
VPPGLPDHISACLFDLDGVLTQTAKVHAKAWKQMFDEYLGSRSGPDAPLREFTQDDYNDYVDGKPRYDGVRSFLESRGIELPQGTPDDMPSAETIDGLGNRKNELVQAIIHQDGVEAYPGSVRYTERIVAEKTPRAVVSSSTNCREVLEAAGLLQYFEHIVDGVVAEQRHLKGKPAPDTFLEGARVAGVEPAAACVFEDALAGVAAGKAGGFGYVVGVDRLGGDHGRDLLEHGASIVVKDLAELL